MVWWCDGVPLDDVVVFPWVMWRCSPGWCGGVHLGGVVVFLWMMWWCSPGCGGGVPLGDVVLASHPVERTSV